MILRNSDLQSVSDLDSIRNSCNVSFKSSHIYFDYLTVLDLSKKGGEAIPPPTTHRKGGFWLLSPFFLLQGADNKGGFWLISAFFLLQGGGGLKSALFT